MATIGVRQDQQAGEQASDQPEYERHRRMVRNACSRSREPPANGVTAGPAGNCCAPTDTRTPPARAPSARTRRCEMIRPRQAPRGGSAMSVQTWTVMVNRSPEVVFAYLTDMSRH